MEGKVVLITGASSGIGAGTAVHFASKCCLLALTARNLDGLQETLRACVQAGCKEDQVLLLSADLLDTDSLGSVVDKTVAKFGRLDVLVNNAGSGKKENFENTTVENYDLIMNTNLKAVFFLTQRAMPHLIQSKGCVVNVSGAAAQRPVKDLVAYCMSKAALEHFTRTVALDVAPKGVRVNAISAAMIKTPLHDKVEIAADYEATAASCHAMGRGGTVEEAARAIAFLADNSQSSFTTGEVLLVDGGYVLMGPF